MAKADIVSPTDPRFRTEIRWGGGVDYVQIGAATTDAEAKARLIEQHGVPGHDFDGFWVQHDLAGVEAAISALKRARRELRRRARAAPKT